MGAMRKKIKGCRALARSDRKDARDTSKCKETTQGSSRPEGEIDK